MAIATATWTYKKSPLAFNRAIVSIKASVTGDASAGSILVSGTHNHLLTPGSRWYLLDAGFCNDDNIGRVLSQSISLAEWESPIYGAITSFHADHIVTVVDYTGTSWFYFKPSGLIPVLPWYLGRNLTGTFTTDVESLTNTNTKSYRWWYTFLTESGEKFT